MSQKRIAHFLIAAGAMAAAGILALALFYAPSLAQSLLFALSVGNEPGSIPSGAQLQALYWLGLSGVWAASLVFLLALFEYFRVSVRIGKERSFCPENVKSLQHIAFFLAVDAVLWIIAIFLPGMFSVPVGPVWLMFLLVSMAHAALALLALGLSKLLSRAVAIQQENDLTV